MLSILIVDLILSSAFDTKEILAVPFLSNLYDPSWRIYTTFTSEEVQYPVGSEAFVGKNVVVNLPSSPTSALI